MTHIGTACIERPNGIVAVGQVYLPRGFAKLNNCFDLRVEPVHMHGFMVLRVSHKSSSLKPYGANAL